VLPETRYAQGEQGRLAYQVVGDGPIDIVPLFSAGSIDLLWDIPPFARWFERLAKFSRLIMFDRRGAGGSDPTPSGAMPTWEEWAEDITLVMDAVGSERAAVAGTLDAGPIAMLFAAAHPDRTTALLVANTTAKFVTAEDYAAGLPLETALAFIETTEAIWGTEDMAAALAPSHRR
jgi:pimeloyl-ACP methyl ester carboxylesterase